jgi:hypothetical protein
MGTPIARTASVPATIDGKSVSSMTTGVVRPSMPVHQHRLARELRDEARFTSYAIRPRSHDPSAN